MLGKQAFPKTDEFSKKFQTAQEKYKGIRDAGSTADFRTLFRILFDILKFKNLEIFWSILKILEHLETFEKI